MYLVGPRARHASVFLHAPAQLDVFVRGEEVLQAVFDVRHYPGQGLAAHDHAGSAHAEVLVVLETEQTEFLLVAAARLSDEHGFPAVHRPEQRGQPVRTNVHVVVGPHEPLVRASIVVPHVLQHEERLFLRRVRVVHRRQPDERQVRGAGRPDRRLRGVEHHAAGHATRPRAVDRGRPSGQIPVGRHHADEQQRLGRSAAAAGRGHLSAGPVVLVVVTDRRRLLLQRPQHAGRPAARTFGTAATGVQPPSAVRPAERVADQQSQDDAGQHVRQTPPTVTGGFLLAAGRRPVFLDRGGLVGGIVVLLLRYHRTAVVMVVPVVVVMVVAVFGVCRGGHRRLIVRTLHRSMHCT